MDIPETIFHDTPNLEQGAMLLELAARGLGLKLRVRGFKGGGFLRQVQSLKTLSVLESGRHGQIFQGVSCTIADTCDVAQFFRLDVGWWEGASC